MRWGREAAGGSVSIEAAPSPVATTPSTATATPVSSDRGNASAHHRRVTVGPAPGGRPAGRLPVRPFYSVREKDKKEKE